MKKHGIKRKELTTIYGLSKSTVSNLNNNKGVNTNTVNHLCAIFNCKISDIIEFEPTVEDVRELEARIHARK